MPGKITVHVDRVAHHILLVRRQRVLLDEDLAALYGVSTKRFNEQARRNLRRFPSDFMIRLTLAEWAFLRSQNATLKTGRGQHRKYPPLAFTEHGAIMAATVLNTPRATQVSVHVAGICSPSRVPRDAQGARAPTRCPRKKASYP
jgi:hypothetical protein